MKIRNLFFICGLLGVSFLLVDAQPQQPEATTIAVSSIQASTQPTSLPDFTLEMPGIGLTVQMEKIVRQGNELLVPSTAPGYYSENEQNLFIVGHNTGIFKRLKEIPSKITIWRNGSPTSYHLEDYQDLPIGEIDMGSLVSYRGVVLMTCSGQNLGEGFSHRLILFYNY